MVPQPRLTCISSAITCRAKTMPIAGDNTSPLGYLKDIDLHTEGSNVIQLETGNKAYYITGLVYAMASDDLSESPCVFDVGTIDGGSEIVSGGDPTGLTSTSAVVEATITPAILTADKLYLTVTTGGDALQSMSVYVYGNYLP